MKRHHLITVHMILSTFLLPFLLMMPLSGGLYLFGIKGDEVREESFEIDVEIPQGELERENYFRELSRAQSLNLDFEYIKENGDTLIFRPTSKDYYSAQDGRAKFTHHRPSLLKKMMELHKGHGPRNFKNFEMLFGLGLLLMTFTGVWMAILIPAYRKKLGISFLLGVLCFALALYV
jgi:hypothetical protein